MRNFYNNLSLMMLAVLMLFGLIPARAAQAAPESEIQLGVTYTLPTIDFGETGKRMSFIPTTSGILTVTTNATTRQSPLSSSAGRLDLLSSTNLGAGWIFTYAVTAYTTYYISYNGMTGINDPLNFVFTMVDSDVTEMEVAVKEITPKPLGAFDGNLYRDGIQVAFSPENVTYGDMYLTYTDLASGEPVTVKVGTEWGIAGGSLRVKINDAYTQAVLNGDVSKGCQVTVENVRYQGTPLNKSYVEGATVSNGNLTINYKIIAALRVIDQKWPAVFYNYWPEGCEDGIAELYFNDNIATVYESSVVFGEHVWGDEGGGGENADPSIEITPIIEGNKVTFDFTGIDFSKYGDLSQYNVVTLFSGAYIGASGMQGFFDGYAVIQNYIPFEDKPYEVPPVEDVFDSEIEGISLSAVPPHGATEEEAAIVNQEEMTEVSLSWGGRELELTGEGGLMVSGPNGYVADFDNDTHSFEIVDGNTIVIDMASVYAEIANSVIDSRDIGGTDYSGVYKFTLAKKTVKINGSGARAIAAENVVYNDETSLYYNINFADNTTTGIGAIETVEGLYKVYNLQGVNILTTEDALLVNNLPAGLYIVNGTKVIIRN